MAYDLEEQEQLAEIKAWWAQYGRLLIVGVIGGLLVIGSVHGWRYYHNTQAIAAATLFDQQQRAERASDHKKVRDIATQMVDHYGSTGYAVLGALLAAKSDFDTGDLAAAKLRLQWVMDNAKDQETVDIARLRLARILFDEKNSAGALKQLEVKPVDSFIGLYADLKGDVLSAQGKRAEARAAYQVALDKSDTASPLRQILQLKLDATGEAK